jgi:hypothetical protein
VPQVALTVDPLAERPDPRSRLGFDRAALAVLLTSTACFEPSRLSLPPPPETARSLLIAVAARPNQSPATDGDRPLLFAYDLPLDPVELSGPSSGDARIALFYYAIPTELLGLEINPEDNQVRGGNERPLPRSIGELLGPPFVAIEARPAALSGDLLPKFDVRPCAANDGCLVRDRGRLGCESSCTATVTIAAVSPPTPPSAAPCAPGWSERTVVDATVCDPPTTVTTRCPIAEIWRDDHCEAVGDPCPADGWPIDAPVDAAFVRAGENGIGTRASPFGTIAEAIASGLELIAIAPGRYRVTARLDGRRLVGACTDRVILESEGPTSAIVVTGGDNTIERLQIQQHEGDAALFVLTGASVSLSEIDVQSEGGVGLQVAGTLSARATTIRTASNGPTLDRAIVVQDATIDLDEVRLYDFLALGIASSEGATVIARDLVTRGADGAVAIKTATDTPVLTVIGGELNEALELGSALTRLEDLQVRARRAFVPTIDLAPGAALSIRRASISGPSTGVRLSTGTLSLDDVQLRADPPASAESAIHSCGAWDVAIARASLVGYRDSITLRGSGVARLQDVVVEAGETEGTMLGLFARAQVRDAPSPSCHAHGKIDARLERAALRGQASTGIWAVAADVVARDVTISDTTYFGVRAELATDEAVDPPSFDAERIRVERSCNTAYSFKDGLNQLVDVAAIATNHSCFELSGDNPQRASHRLTRAECRDANGPGLISFRPRTSTLIQDLVIDGVGGKPLVCDMEPHARGGEGVTVGSPGFVIDRFSIARAEIGMVETALGLEGEATTYRLSNGIFERNDVALQAIDGGPLLESADAFQFRDNKTGVTILGQ